MSEPLIDPLKDMNTHDYWYSGHIKQYLLQFMAIFAGIQVKVGSNDKRGEGYVKVPVHYAHIDRVYAAIKNQNTQNAALSLPVITVNIDGIRLAPESASGVGVSRTVTRTPLGGVIPNDTRTFTDTKPYPLKIDFRVDIIASNNEQFYQIFEQIIPLFNTVMTFQKSDSPLDGGSITSAELKNISFTHNHPPGADRRWISCALMFEVRAWISTPVEVRKNFIEKIMVRIGVINTATSKGADILKDLDANGFVYDTVIDAATDLIVDVDERAAIKKQASK